MPLPELESKRLICVVGKGGVGRTTVAAALAVQLTERGKTVLLYQANAKEKLSGLLGGPPVGEQIVEVRDRLWAVNPTPASALREYGLMVLRYETVYKMVFENRLSKALIRAIPGVDDYAILGKLWYHTTEESGARPKYDVAIFDAPATGHAVTMLRIPQAILEAVPDGPLTRDAHRVRALLQDPARTGTVVVTLAEEMPTNESIELAGRLERESGIKANGLVVNQLYPDRFGAGTPAARVLGEIGDAGEDPALEAVLPRARMSRSRRALNEKYLARLAKELPLPSAHLPILFVPTLGPQEVEKLSRLLGEQLPRGRAAARRS